MNLEGLEQSIREIDEMIADHEPWVKGCAGKNGPLVESFLKIHDGLLAQRKSFLQTYELVKDQFCIECGTNRPQSILDDTCESCAKELERLYG